MAAVSQTGPAKRADDFLRPNAIEVATSWLPGFLPAPQFPDDDVTPLQALEAAIRPALIDGPCYVGFSGGRDSAAILAVAARLARREQLPDPVPVTLTYPEVPESDESSWQRRVVDYVGITEWIHIRITDEQDLVGEEAQDSLRRRGLLWPATMHVKAPLLRQLHGGWLLTGEGGDEVLGPRRITPATILVRHRARPTWARVSGTARALEPSVVRRARARSQLSRDVPTPWLREEIRRSHLARAAADDATEPLRWDAALRWLMTRRVAQTLQHNYRLVAADHGVTLEQPLITPAFVAAMGRWGGAWGFRGRTAVMRRLFGDVLPYDVISRTSKARFNTAYIGRQSRAFARSWTGAGVNTDFVDPALLREQWISPEPSSLTGLLLQAAWLAENSAPGAASDTAEGGHR